MAQTGLYRLVRQLLQEGDLQGSGSVALLVFQAAPEARGATDLRFEALAVTDAGGRVLPTQTLAPPRLAIQP
jgi:hypothetical protein